MLMLKQVATVKLSDKLEKSSMRPHIGTAAPGDRVSVNTPLHEVQRPLSETAVRNHIELVGTIDWNMFGYVVAVRYPDGTLNIIDGQHRISIVKTLSPETTEVPAHIINVPNKEYAAKLFAYLNGLAIRRISNEELLWAQLVAKDPEALMIKKYLELAGLTCGQVNPGFPQVKRATFAKCLALGKAETVRAAEYIKAAYPDRGSIDLLLHGLTRLLTLEPYTALNNDLTLGKMFKEWFTDKLPETFEYRDACFKEYQNNSSWQVGIAYGLYDRFCVYMKKRGKRNHCPPENTIKDLYLKGLN